MIICLILIIIISFTIGSVFTSALDDKELNALIVILAFVLGFNIAIFICYAIPDCKSQAIKDYTSGKYRKEVTYKIMQKDSLMIPVDSTIVYKPIKNEKLSAVTQMFTKFLSI